MAQGKILAGSDMNEVIGEVRCFARELTLKERENIDVLSQDGIRVETVQKQYLPIFRGISILLRIYLIYLFIY